jgi:hypothetical protein
MKRIPELTDADVNRFWDKVAKGDGCWLWTAATNRQGYGVIKKQGIMYQATRWMYFIAYGIDPERLSVCHKCDTPGCVNPDHLWLGTRKDNNRDCDKKSRRPVGENHSNAKLTEKEVREIFKSREVYRILALQHGVSISTIFNIKKGLVWNHVTGLPKGSTTHEDTLQNW